MDSAHSTALIKAIHPVQRGRTALYREIQLSGAVVDSYSLANQGAYRIDDETGQLWVVSDKGTPRRAHGSPSRERFVKDSISVRWAIRSSCRGLGVGLVLLESSHTAK